MMKVTMKNEIRRIGATHLCMVSSERVRSHCYLYLCNRCKKLWVRACARMRQTLHSHTHFMTIRLIEQNFKWFISFGLFNWKYVALQFSHSFLIIIKSDGYRYCAATCFMSLTEKKKYVNLCIWIYGSRRHLVALQLNILLSINRSIENAYFSEFRNLLCVIMALSLCPRNRFH